MLYGGQAYTHVMYEKATSQHHGMWQIYPNGSSVAGQQTNILLAFMCLCAHLLRGVVRHGRLLHGRHLRKIELTQCLDMPHRACRRAGLLIQYTLIYADIIARNGE